jgi:hypothetical protein
MTVDELRAGVYWLAERLYSDACLTQRRRPFFDELWRQRESAAEVALS